MGVKETLQFTEQTARMTGHEGIALVMRQALAEIKALEGTIKDLKEDVRVYEVTLGVLFAQFYPCGHEMDGQHYWMFRSTRWPMTHMRGPTVEEAMALVIREVIREWGGKAREARITEEVTSPITKPATAEDSPS